MHLAHALAPPKEPPGLDGGDAALCLTPVVLLVAGGVVAAILLGRSQKRKADARMVAMREQEQRNAAWAQNRASALAARFGRDVADRILRGQVWHGQTEEQLREALGSPADSGEVASMGRVVRVLRYAPRGGGRFALRVSVERGVVVGWEDER